MYFDNLVEHISIVKTHQRSDGKEFEMIEVE